MDKWEANRKGNCSIPLDDCDCGNNDGIEARQWQIKFKAQCGYPWKYL